jgi:formate dehydrogenase subunit gamma
MRMLRRYDDRTRMLHWAVALLFFAAGLSGLALFHPGFFFLSNLFGGGTWDRILHPYFGLFMVLAFVPIFVWLWRDARWRPEDRAWMRHSRQLMRGHEEEMPPAGRYNAGQKIVFWSAAITLLVLLVTGFFFWQPWFADAVPIPLRRAMVLLHAFAAFVLVLTIIVHIYSAIWVKGSVRAMTRGTVNEAWARHHHPLWVRDIDGER